MKAWRVLMVALGVSLAASAVIWTGLARYGMTRELEGTLRVSRASAGWSWEWTRASDGRVNGAWVDWSAASGTERLEVECSGRAKREGATFRLWLYRVTPTRSGEAEVDLKSVVEARDPARVEGKWSVNRGGAGVIFEGPGPGVLRVDVPVGGVKLLIARTAEGGVFRARIGDGGWNEFENYLEGSDERATVEVRGLRDGGERTLVVRQRIPSYAISGWRLRWDGGGGGASLAEARVTTRVMGWTVRREAVRAAGGADGAGGRIEIDTGKAGALEFVPVRGLTLGEHARGFLRVLGIGWSVVVIVTAAGVFVASARGRARSLDVLAFTVVVAAHAWIASWSPVMFCPDSVDYMSGAVDWAEGRASLARFDRFRLPGYPFVAGMVWKGFGGEGFNAALGAIQGVLGVGTCVLAWWMARRVAGGRWAAVAMLVVGLNPVHLAWTRYAMSETLSEFLATLAMALAVRAWGPRGESARGYGLDVAAAVALGLVAACGAYVRGNLQLLVLASPALVVVLGWKGWGRWRALGLGGIALAAGVVPMVPRMAGHLRDHGMAGFTLGGSFARFILGEPNGVMDLNQSAVVSAEEWAAMRSDREAGRANEWSLAPRLMGSKRFPPPEGTKGFGADEARYRVFSDESLARFGRERVGLAFEAFVNVMGLWPWEYRAGFQENDVWTRPLRGIDATRGSNFFTDAAHAAKHGPGGEKLNQFCRKDVSGALRRKDARVLADWWGADRVTRPLWAGLAFVAVGAGVVRRDWRLAWIAGVVVAHAGVLAWIMLAGLDRYGVPMEPALRVAAVGGMAWLVGWWSRGRGAHAGAKP